ncbi:anaerobic ribonucleoside-triphosphate reductase [Pleomorphomonas sp. PLEO]|uniref:anaerobic ribonucleoside-triphosphate reductase n=1 Tax=Pleomorphomonas sp. PLEO TaxID=3239306 RepID=UPI00351DEC9B
MNKPLSAIKNDAAALLSNDERQPCEIWTRVMGYHRPVSSFNKGKKSEFAERTAFAEGKSLADARR